MSNVITGTFAFVRLLCGKFLSVDIIAFIVKLKPVEILVFTNEMDCYRYKGYLKKKYADI